MFRRVMSMVRCVEFVPNMSFSLPIWCHQARIYFLDVCAPYLSRDMGQPIFPFDLVLEQFADDLYVKS